jgi:hypothetical protein
MSEENQNERVFVNWEEFRSESSFQSQTDGEEIDPMDELSDFESPPSEQIFNVSFSIHLLFI